MAEEDPDQRCFSTAVGTQERDHFTGIERNFQLAQHGRGDAQRVCIGVGEQPHHRWEGSSEPRDGACFYEEVNFGGNSFCVRAGESLAAMPRGMNDRVSSIRTFGRSEVTVYRDDSFGCGSVRFDDDTPDRL